MEGVVDAGPHDASSPGRGQGGPRRTAWVKEPMTPDVRRRPPDGPRPLVLQGFVEA